MNKKLILFEVTGALLDDEIGGFGDILTILGKGRDAKEIEMEYERRKHFGLWLRSMEMYAQLYKGFPEKYLKKIALKYCKEALRSRVGETLIKLKRKGHLLGALTANPSFLTDTLSEILPLDIVEGTQFEFKDGVCVGKIKRKVDRLVMIDLLKEKRERLGLKKDQVIIISDSTSVTQLPMAEEAGFFVGFNPEKESLKEVVETLISQKNLKGIFKL